MTTTQIILAGAWLTLIASIISSSSTGKTVAIAYATAITLSAICLALGAYFGFI